MTLRRCLLLALFTATVLGVGLVVLVVRVAAVAADALAQMLVQVGWLVAIPYALVSLVHLVWFATLPQVVLFLLDKWAFLADCWKWLMGG